MSPFAILPGRYEDFTLFAPKRCGKVKHMPATVKKKGKKFRVVEPDGTLVKGPSGTPVDGGGYASKAKAQAQARAINASKVKKHGKA